MRNNTPLTPVEEEIRRRSRKRKLILLAVLIVLGAYFFWKFNPDRPVDYSEIEEHFKYGSIGSEPATGVPYWILKVLPVMFADKLPGGGLRITGIRSGRGQGPACWLFQAARVDRPCLAQLRSLSHRHRSRYAGKRAAGLYRDARQHHGPAGIDSLLAGMRKR